ncbi:MAG: inverse autotransporter beta domain-containing protein [Candidatus Omnitrophica bacterium]|nr:inverse autotransporter beta domain-containing protein [Candidatus Omnitrophota bacterium]MDD5574550.1 inverse autotransporter beta domain-containing protein [Candidatus Omnitrophota bacterium]
MKKAIVSLMVFAVCELAFPPRSFSYDAAVVNEWLERIELSLQVETGKKPVLYFQTVQPLYQSFDKINTFFIQPRVSWSGGEETYSAGVGYRRLVSEDWLLGVNAFGDYAEEHAHGRAGLGFEALGQVLEARFNSYFGVTPRRVVEESTVQTTYEKAADGCDFELGLPVPYVPWLKVFGSGFWYDFEKFQDKFGWKARLEATLAETVRCEFYTWDDNKGGQEYGGRVRFFLAFDHWRDILEAFKLSGEPFPAKDMKKETLVPVERSFEVTVERWTESKTGGLTFEIKRGD